MISDRALMKGRIDGVTGLRGLAVIAVIAFHYWENFFPMGYLGVDIFFIISGYCICAAFYKKRFQNEWAKKFVINRIYRLAPTSSIVILLTLIIGYISFQEFISHSISAEGLSALLVISNFYYFLTTDYFGSESIAKPLLHMWSLSTEWQCYALFFLAIIFLKKKQYFYIYIALLLFSLFFVKKIAYNHANIDIDYEGAYGLEYYWLTPHLLEFSAGAAAFLICSHIQNISIPKKLLNFSLAILIFILVAILFGRTIEYTTAIWIISTITFGIIFFLGIGTQNIFLENLLITSVGTISYSLYLVHWPVLSLVFLMSKNYVTPVNFHNDLLKILILTIAVSISIFLYFYIEKPLRYKPITKNRNIFYYFFYLCLIFLAFYLFKKTYPPVKLSSPSVTESYYNEEQTTPPSQSAQQVIASDANLASDKSVFPTEDDLIQYHKKYYGGAIEWDINNSDAPVVWSRQMNDEKERSIVLFGDSHARQYALGFFSKKNSYKKMFYVRPKRIMKCDPLEMNLVNELLKGGAKDIYITARWDYYGHLFHFFTTPSGMKEYVPPLSELTLFYKNQIDDCLSKLNLSSDDKVFIIGSLPEVTDFKAVYVCQNSAKSDSSCLYERIEKSKRISYRMEFNSELKKLLKESSPSAVFVDPFDIFCDKKVGHCTITKNGNLLYSDQNHLSLSGALFFLEKLNIP